MRLAGQFHLTLVSNEWSIVGACTEWSLPQNDGLMNEWNYQSIYVNPPYGADRVRGTTIRNWFEKCEHAFQHFDSEVLALVPVAVNTMHWKLYVWGKATGVCFLYDTRLKFLVNGKSDGKGAPMACSMVYWGKNYHSFFEVFIKFGAVVDLRELKRKQLAD